MKQKMAGKPSMAKQNPKNVCEGQTERGGGKWGENVHPIFVAKRIIN